MRIYTKAGDTGETGLYGGQRVSKDDIRVEAYGTVDEANALLGVVVTYLQDDSELRELTQELQRDLFTLGADLATPQAREAQAGKALVPRISEEQVSRLEAVIDRYEDTLSPLQNFILPGGTPAAATLHLARTVVRRAERRVVTLAADAETGEQSVNPVVLSYLNRLSDLLFVLARAANQRSGVTDIPWSRGTA